jgi:hypothetical protein
MTAATTVAATALAVLGTVAAAPANAPGSTVYASRCGVDQRGRVAATVVFRNRSEGTLSYFMVKVSFLDQRGRQFAQAWASAVDVPPGGVARDRVTGYVKPTGRFSCRVTNM